MNKKSSSIELWVNVTGHTRNILRALTPFVEKRRNIIPLNLEKDSLPGDGKIKQGYVVFYRFIRNWREKLQSFHRQHQEEYFDFAASLHECNDFSEQMIEKFSEDIYRKKPCLFPYYFSNFSRKEFFRVFFNENIGSLTKTSAMVSVLISELNDASIVKLSTNDSQNVFCQFCHELFENYVQQILDYEKIIVKEKEIADEKEKLINKLNLSEIDSLGLIKQKILLRKVDNRHLRVLLCYQIITEISTQNNIKKTHLLNLYLLHKVMKIWLGYYLSSRDTCVRGEDFSEPFEIIKKIKEDTEKFKVYRRNINKNELKRKASGVLESDLFEQIDLSE